MCPRFPGSLWLRLKWVICERAAVLPIWQAELLAQEQIRTTSPELAAGTRDFDGQSTSASVQWVPFVSLSLARAHRVRGVAGPTPSLSNQEQDAERIRCDSIRHSVRSSRQTALMMPVAVSKNTSAFAVTLHIEVDLTGIVGGVHVTIIRPGV